MPAVRLPLSPSNPNYGFAIDLAGITYSLGFRWNERDAAWYMDVVDVDGKMVAAGLKLVLGQWVGFRHVAVPNFPRGVFILGDSSGQNVDAGLDDLGARVQVTFYSFTDLAVLLAKAGGWIA
jgi:hypothetical protein